MHTLFLVFLAGLAWAAPTLSPPPNFHEVEPGLYRGGSLSAESTAWLSGLGVATIVKLDDENMAELGYGIPVDYLHINEIGLNLSYEFMLKILAHIDADRARGPVYVHCEKGADRTGLVIALYRVQHDGWTPRAAWNEMNAPQFGHSKLQFWIDHKFYEYSAELAGPVF